MNTRKFVFWIALVAIVVLAMGSTALAQEQPTPVPWTQEQAIALYNISGTYSVSECEYEGSVEDNCWRFTGTVQMVNPHNEWVDGYRRCEGETRPAFSEMQRAARISIPPLYSTTQACFVEVLIARPAAPTQQSELEARGENEVQWPLSEAVKFFQLEGPDVAIERHGIQSWEVPAVDQLSWTLTNVCSNWLDGYRVNPGEVRPDFSEHPEREFVSIPPHSYSIEVEMATFRPCEVPQEFILTPLGNQAVNVRSEPSEQSEILDSLQPLQNDISDGFVVIADQQWYRVWSEDGAEWIAGWVVSATPVVAVQSTPIALSTPVPAQPAPQSDWSEAAVRQLFGIPAETVLAQCAEETNCWQTTGPHNITNSSQCWQGGYTTTEHELMPGQTDPKTGIPPAWSGFAEVAVLRPCS